MINEINPRRDFLKKAGLTSAAATLGTSIFGTTDGLAKSTTGKISISNLVVGKVFAPFESIEVKSTVKGIFTVRDSKGRIYSKSKPNAIAYTFDAGAALGMQTVTLEDEKNQLLDLISFELNAKTEIADSQKLFSELMYMLCWSMIGEWGQDSIFKYNGRLYNVLVPWMRDHTHTMKGMKYFYADLKDGFDLYADTQRADGLIWDNIYIRKPENNWWDEILEKGNFILPIENRTYEFKRQPVEADVEYLFVECLYYTWKATGDTTWMKLGLDKAIKALNYSVTDSYRWSKKYNLIKRGFTIDTWDFTHEYDTKVMQGANMSIDDEKSDFGIMYGDNNGYIMGCKYVAEMLEATDRKSEAQQFRTQQKTFQDRLDKLCWNGKHYTHFVPEPQDFWNKRNIDPSLAAKQVTLSNAYALNRGISHEQAVAIINTYQNIKKEMPATSAGEWYNLYPPFPSGFSNDNGMWDYMNGGVTTMVAGELAHGAFEHGFEDYGVDILKRTLEIGRRHNGYLACTFKGKLPDVPKANFTPISLKAIVNANFVGKASNGVPGFSGEGEINDLSELPTGNQVFKNIPFEIVNPANNGGKGCLILCNTAGYKQEATLPIGKKATSIYLLHARSRTDLFAYLTINYKDGTSHTDYVVGDKIQNWWYPEDTGTCKVGWRGKNKKCTNIGLGIYGINNPQVEKEIVSITFYGMLGDPKWFVAAVTLSDAPVYFPSTDVSYGIPDRWGSAALVYATIEGLVGVKDTGLAFDKALLAPRWSAANETEATATVKYEASGGYLSYRYKHDVAKNIISITFTGTAEDTDLEVLLPKGKAAVIIKWNNTEIPLIKKTIEASQYACCNVKNIGINTIEITLA